MRAIAAELVPDVARWERAIPLASDFSIDRAFAAIDMLKSDVATEVKRLGRKGVKASPALQEAFGRILGMDDWLASQTNSPLPVGLATDFRNVLLARGRRVYAAMKSFPPNPSVVGTAEDMEGVLDLDKDILHSAFWFGLGWVASRLLTRK